MTFYLYMRFAYKSDMLDNTAYVSSLTRNYCKLSLSCQILFYGRHLIGALLIANMLMSCNQIFVPVSFALLQNTQLLWKLLL